MGTDPFDSLLEGGFQPSDAAQPNALGVDVPPRIPGTNSPSAVSDPGDAPTLTPQPSSEPQQDWRVYVRPSAPAKDAPPAQPTPSPVPRAAGSVEVGVASGKTIGAAVAGTKSRRAPRPSRAAQSNAPKSLQRYWGVRRTYSRTRNRPAKSMSTGWKVFWFWCLFFAAVVIVSVVYLAILAWT
ncbi:MAG: hypothetical protein LBN10_10165 [Propionibacteriaceae bacterium]|nr:hypothetical protein [Propionibacteriaceae bacterium]